MFYNVTCYSIPYTFRNLILVASSATWVKSNPWANAFSLSYLTTHWPKKQNNKGWGQGRLWNSGKSFLNNKRRQIVTSTGNKLNIRKL